VGAQKLWDDPDLLEIPVKTEDEPRFLIIGVIAGKLTRGEIIEPFFVQYLRSF
jgi:hypothetical protein